MTQQSHYWAYTLRKPQFKKRHVPQCSLQLFTIARTWKPPKCPSTGEWIKKMWHIYTVEYHSAIKRNKTELFVVSWMDLESVIQSEVKSEREKQIPYANTYIWNLKKKKKGSDEPRGRTGIEMQT